MSNLNTDITYIPQPVNLDRHIQTIQQKLEGLVWLEKSFGRAFRVPEYKNGHKGPLFYPGRYVGDGEYQDLSKNDKLKSYSFIVAEDNAGYQEELVSQSLSIIFWLDLEKIDKTKPHIFIEDLRADVSRIIHKLPLELTLNNFRHDAANVFRGFDTYQKDMMYPYACMKFDCTITYMEEC